MKSTIKERQNFYKLIEKNKELISFLYPYFNKKNKYIIKYQFVSKAVLFLSNPVIQLLMKIKK
jgi:hypothetical protein